MKRNVTKISLAALAGASCLLTGYSAKAALTITDTITPNVTFTNGTYDVVVFDLTGMTGVDATPGENAGNTQDPELLGLSGIFTVTGGTGTPEMAAVGVAGSKQGAAFLSGAGASYGTGVHSSYVAFPSDTGAVITEVGSSTKSTGNASSITDSWYVTPGTGSGNVGGIEPAKDPQGLTVASGGSDPYANNGMIAEILVNHGATVSFVGSYSDYGYAAGNTINFSSGTTTTTTTSNPNKIISLITGSAPTTYGAQVGTLDVHTGSPASVSFSGVGLSTGYVAVTGENGSSPELYGLELDLNGTPILPTDTVDLDKIIADITGSNSNVSSVTTVVGSPFAGVFPAGYDLLVTTTTGSASPFFGFDFTADTTTPGVTVTGVAAVPEPASMVGIAMGAAGLMLGRRKNRVA